MSLLNAELYSYTLKRNVRLDLILPEEPSADRWRLLLLLHGYSDNESMWRRMAAAERYAREYSDLVIAMPDTELCWYTNTAVGERWFDYVANEVPTAVRRLLPRLSHDRADTYAAGLSMGGYGALKCAFTYPEHFGGAASFSGALDIPRHRVRGIIPVDDALYDDVFGPASAFAGSENDVYALARRCSAPKPRVYLWCGTLDPFLNDTTLMRETLRECEFDVVSSVSEGGHEWTCWDAQLGKAVEWMYGKGEEACR